MHRLAPALALVSTLALASAREVAAASPRTSSLGLVRLAGAESCSGPRALAQGVEARLGREVFVSPSRADVAVEARLERLASPDRWRAVIALSGADGAPLGTRELESADPRCSALDEQLALVIAVMIDPDAALASRPSRAPALTPTPAPLPLAPPPVVTRELVPVPYAVAPAPSRWRAAVQGELAFALGLLPNPAVGLAVRGRVTPPRGPIFVLGGTGWFPNEGAQGGLGARFAMAAAHLAVCPLELATGATRLFGCAGVDVGALRVGGFGFDLSRSHEQLVFDAALEAELARRLVGPLVGSLTLGVLAPFVRDRFYYLDASGQQREVFQATPVAGALQIGVGVEFP